LCLAKGSKVIRDYVVWSEINPSRVIQGVWHQVQQIWVIKTLRFKKRTQIAAGRERIQNEYHEAYFSTPKNKISK
jgi:hypothetical protein